jgi:hypothetical protein
MFLSLRMSTRWWIGLGVAGGLALVAVPYANQPASSPALSSSGQSAKDEVAPSRSVEQTIEITLADALVVAERGLQRLDREVIDYSARLVKQERVNGRLEPPSEMLVKIQNPGRDSDGRVKRPMRVYLFFKEPEAIAGREVIWCADQWNRELIAHETGVLGLVRLKLDPHGALAMYGNRYPIERIGLANLVEELLRRGRAVTEPERLKVSKVDSVRVAERDCALIRIESRAPEDQLGFCRIDVAVDLERELPVHLATFQWPNKKGDAPLLDESYTYYDILLNVGLVDADFDPDNPRYKFP